MMAPAYDDDTLALARDVLVQLRGMVELLDGCPLEYKLSAGLFVGLLRPMTQSMDQIVGDLCTQAGIPPPSMHHGAMPN